LITAVEIVSTDPAVTVKVAEVAPAFTVTVARTVAADGLLLLKDTAALLLGGLVRVTVPVDVAPLDTSCTNVEHYSRASMHKCRNAPVVSWLK
jgi:hypothetical protein